MNEISISELQAILPETVVIDVRELDEFTSGHVPGAIHIPLSTVPVRMNELDREVDYQVICEAGGRSAQACAYLEAQGFSVANVLGGTGAWRVAGYELETGV